MYSIAKVGGCVEICIATPTAQELREVLAIVHQMLVDQEWLEYEEGECE